MTFSSISFDRRRSPVAAWFGLLVERYLIWILVGATFAIMTAINPRFLSQPNLLNIALSSSVLGIMVIALTIPLLTGKLDLSIESTLAFAALVGGMMVKADYDPVTCMIVVLSIGAVIGLINGVLIVYLEVNPFIQTLAMNIVVRGLVFMVSAGFPFSGFPAGYRIFGASTVFGVSTPILILLALYAVFIVLLSRTPWGRKIYAIGQNPTAAHASGIDVKRYTLGVFLLSSMLAAFAGLILTTRLNSVDYNIGIGMLFDIFAAAVIGGIALTGGRGSLVGAFGGVLFLTLLSSALTWMKVSVYWIETIKGGMILLAVWLDAAKSRLRERASATSDQAR